MRATNTRHEHQQQAGVLPTALTRYVAPIPNLGDAGVEEVGVGGLETGGGGDGASVAQSTAGEEVESLGEVEPLRADASKGSVTKGDVSRAGSPGAEAAAVEAVGEA